MTNYIIIVVLGEQEQIVICGEYALSWNNNTNSHPKELTGLLLVWNTLYT